MDSCFACKAATRGSGDSAFCTQRAPGRLRGARCASCAPRPQTRRCSPRWRPPPHATPAHSPSRQPTCVSARARCGQRQRRRAHRYIKPFPKQVAQHHLACNTRTPRRVSVRRNAAAARGTEGGFARHICAPRTAPHDRATNVRSPSRDVKRASSYSTFAAHGQPPSVAPATRSKRSGRAPSTTFFGQPRLIMDTFCRFDALFVSSCEGVPSAAAAATQRPAGLVPALAAACGGARRPSSRVAPPGARARHGAPRSAMVRSDPEAPQRPMARKQRTTSEMVACTFGLLTWRLPRALPHSKRASVRARCCCGAAARRAAGWWCQHAARGGMLA